MSGNYFSHDSNARNDTKIINVRMKYGMEGYGIYFAILERLREEDEYMSIKSYNTLAFDLHVDASLIKDIVENFGLFAFTDDGKCFYSESFNRRMEIKDAVKNKRVQAGKKGAAKRWNEDDSNKAMANATEKNSKAIAKPSEIDGKESKEKESKENKNKEHSPAKAEPLIDYAKVIDYLNEQSGKRYRDTDTNRKLIKARLTEGFTATDIKSAIDNVVIAWSGTDMAQYIRPATIFQASKFEGYVNAPPYPPKPKATGSNKSRRLEKRPDWMDPNYQPPKEEVTPEMEAQLAANQAKLAALRHKNSKEEDEHVGS